MRTLSLSDTSSSRFTNAVAGSCSHSLVFLDAPSSSEDLDRLICRKVGETGVWINLATTKRTKYRSSCFFYLLLSLCFLDFPQLLLPYDQRLWLFFYQIIPLHTRPSTDCLASLNLTLPFLGFTLCRVLRIIFTPWNPTELLAPANSTLATTVHCKTSQRAKSKITSQCWAGRITNTDIHNHIPFLTLQLIFRRRPTK